MPTKRSQEFMDLKHGNDKKASKPLIEKRRRARINHSLAQLKTLVIDSKSESTRQTKLEKADILEMTVQHLREIKKRETTVTTLDARYGKKKFEIGFMECVRQVELFLASLMDPNLTEIEEGLKRRLKDHLCRSLQDMKGDETTQTNVADRTSSPNLLPPSPPPHAPFIITNEQKSTSKECNDGAVDLVQNRTVLKSSYSNKVIHDDCERDQMNFNYTVGSEDKIENFDRTAHQVSSETFKSRYAPCSEQETVAKTRFTSTLGNLERDQSPPYSLDSNTSFSTRESLKTKYLNDSNNYHNTSCFNSNNSISFHNSCEEKEQKQSTSSLKSNAFDNGYHQIPVIPRRLSNGEWALVLPGNLALTNNESQNSAFRLVWPSSNSSEENEQHGMRQQLVNSPLSSSVSDMSSEDYSYRMDIEVPVKIEHEGQSDFGYVWRPW
ncbi:transcription factor HES-1 [Trichonephila inaurata madagascariensis]|uniref:Transcription factor HES-1 n=1 Tax=Trichonephila inaurata madagascariensis TaxID=2747483 RepID=A0A8X7CD00_9ARAC|nr:transcription factor HES-1 [Trichonephila inaurata madagascariensis]